MVFKYHLVADGSSPNSPTHWRGGKEENLSGIISRCLSAILMSHQGKKNLALSFNFDQDLYNIPVQELPAAFFNAKGNAKVLARSLS